MAGRAGRNRGSRGSGAEGIAGVLILLLFVAVWYYLPRINWQTIVLVSVFAFSIVVLVMRWFWLRYHRQQRERLLLADALTLTATEFEQRIAVLLSDLGWQNIERVGGAGDGGVDLRARRGGVRYIIQCKRYKGLVSPSHIRDLAGTLTHETADRAILVTTGYVSQQTRAWITDKPIEIWDGEMLAQQIRQVADADQSPQRRAQRRRANWQFIVLLAGINVLTIMLVTHYSEPTLAATTARLLGEIPPSAVVAVEQPTPETPTPQPTATPQPTPQPTITPTPGADGVVANGGNVRAQPSLDGLVLDQVHADETVTLLGRTGDGLWVQIVNARGFEGWVHISLLNIDPAVLERVPIEE